MWGHRARGTRRKTRRCTMRSVMERAEAMAGRQPPHAGSLNRRGVMTAPPPLLLMVAIEASGQQRIDYILIVMEAQCASAANRPEL